MAVITPESDLILLTVPLEIDNKNQLTFANATAQYNYFHGLTGKRTFDKFTYIRKDAVIKVPELIDNLYQYNYVMYRNENFSNKWFYAYITGLEFESPTCTAISIKTDVWQTWFPYIILKTSFVEREHVNDDTVGLHTIPEGLEVGDYLIEKTKLVDLTAGSFMVCFMVTEPPYNGAPVTHITQSLGNAFCGLLTFATRLGDASKIIEMYDRSSATTTDAVVNIYMIPEELVYTNQYSTWTVDTLSASIFQLQTSALTVNTASETETQTFQGYTPVNKKLLCYPYKYARVTNNAGTDIEYRWEDFSKNQAGNFTMNTKVIGLASCGSPTKLVFENYKNHNSTELASGITGSKLPTCAWKTDYYTNWLTQNAVNIGVSTATAALGIAAGVLTAGTSTLATAGAVAGSAMSIGRTMGEITKAKTTPDQAKGDSTLGDLNFAWQDSGFNIYDMAIRKEYAQIIDNYFSEFGYKVNLVKIPNISSRANWNYIKTIGCLIVGDIPQEDLNEIKGMFDAGITFWHNPATFGDYSQSNTIVS